MRSSLSFAEANAVVRLAVMVIQLCCGLAMFAGSSPQPYAGKGLRVGSLSCEYLTHPKGIAESQPRLAWISESGERGQRQTAYRVLVASSEASLKKDAGDLWDSGKVDSDQSIHVNYAGVALKSRQECFWKVCVWDKDGHAAWSEPSHWSMGLLATNDWHGKWIGRDELVKSNVLKGADWICAPGSNAEPVVCYYRRQLVLPSDRAVTSARMMVSAINRAVIYANGIRIGPANTTKTATGLDLSVVLKPGTNTLAVSVDFSGVSPTPAPLLALLKIEFTSGKPMVLTTDASWKVARQETERWEQPGFKDADWVSARKLGPAGMKPWGEIFEPASNRLPARWLRKEFQVAHPVRRATVSFSGLGLSELFLNGKKVGDEVLSPGLTHYTKRIFYVTHDVTEQIRKGKNAVGVVLGNGRFFALRQLARDPNYGFPKLRLQLDIEYADGSPATEIVSDESWRLSADGPILANNEYDGEEYDARKEFKGWAEANFDDSRWEDAQVVAEPGGEVVPQMIFPIRVTQTLKPVKITEPQPGVFIFDMGQNMVGWCRLQVSGPAGKQITLRHAETLKPDGILYLDNIRTAKVTDRYTLQGGGVEIWEPRFAYHGFRFVEVRGWPGKPLLSSIEGRVVNDDLPSAGNFSCSQPLVNRIYQNILWGTRGNYRSIPTDCPQRDERQGWLGDRSEEARGETYLFNVAAFYNKWTQDMADAQKDNGSIPDVCPPYWPIYKDNVTWPSSAIIIPGTVAGQYADTRIIVRQYPSMVKWIDHMSSYIADGIISKDNYADWCVPPENLKLIHSKDSSRKTSPAIIATTYFQHCLTLMAGYATSLGKADDAKRFTDLAGQLKEALNKNFYNAERGCYDNGSQTSCVLPLAFDLVPEGERQRVFDHLVKKISEESRGHIGTGLIGGQWLNRVLTAGGRADLSFGFATNTVYPSWGYMIGQGATTIWELWNGNTADPAMNSGNHVMLIGDLTTWFFEGLAGIAPDPAQPGFKHILMRPHIVAGLDWVKASHRSPYGLIASAWRVEQAKLRWQITVPANSTATLWLPAGEAAIIRESGKPLAQSAGVKVLRTEAGATLCKVQAGSYEFEMPPPQFPADREK